MGAKDGGEVSAAQVRDFWIEEVGPKGWYAVEAELDAEITRRFGALWEAARDGDLRGWRNRAEDTLALLIVLDQFPRNMFRGDGRSFATDGAARALAKWAVHRGFDRQIKGAARQFFYLPLMHSEVLEDQERALCWFLIWGEEAAGNIDHARAHRQVIRDFGRFPYRNAALGRHSTERERSYLEAGGYGWTLRRLQAGEDMRWQGSA